jgi:chromosome partitioning protein
MKPSPSKGVITLNRGDLLAIFLRELVNVLLVDTDLQRIASHWVDRRNSLNGLASVHCAERRGNVFHALRDLTQRYNDVVVDAGGRDSEELRTALVAVQKVYVPLLLRLRYP